MIPRIRQITEVGEPDLEGGASAVEYGLLLAAIAAIAIGIVFGIGVLVNDNYQDTCANLKAESPASTADCS